MLRKCEQADLQRMFEIINESAQAYKGIIPEDRWHEPYMPMKELAAEVEDGVRFWGYESESGLAGVMGIQDKGEVTLIRHAYVLKKDRNRGIGTALLRHLETIARTPILVGTWKAAQWAVAFYEKNGYSPVPEEEKNRLLRKFWNIPERQVETSVVLARQRDESEQFQKSFLA